MENNENGFAPEMEAPQEQPVEQPVEHAQQDAPKQDVSAMIDDGLDKAKGVAQNLLAKAKTMPKKLWVAAGAAVAALVAVIFVLALLGNTYKTPVKLSEKALNAKSFNQYMKASSAVLNGFCEKEYKQMLNLMKKSEDYKDDLEDTKESYKEYIEELKDEYGNNYRYRVKFEDKEKLDKDDTEEFEETLNDYGEEILEQCEDLDSDDYEDIADELGISKSQAKKAVKIAKAIGRKLKNAKVTKGYELEVVRILKGSELDEPEESDSTVYVYKVNGRWITSDVIWSLRSIIP